MTRSPFFVRRIFTVLLTLSMALAPAPAHALRPGIEGHVRAGLEEDRRLFPVCVTEIVFQPMEASKQPQLLILERSPSSAPPGDFIALHGPVRRALDGFAELAGGLGNEQVYEGEIFLRLEEVDRALADKLGAGWQERDRVRRWLRDVCRILDPPARKDVPVLWLALAVHSDILVTGDKDLLKLDEIRGIKIIPPSRFFESSWAWKASINQYKMG